MILPFFHFNFWEKPVIKPAKTPPIIPPNKTINKKYNFMLPLVENYFKIKVKILK